MGGWYYVSFCEVFVCLFLSLNIFRSRGVEL